MGLTPTAFDEPKQLQALVSWHYRQLKLDGTFEPWTAFGSGATGTKCEHTTTRPGIFEIKATMTSTGSATDFFYQRRRNDPHSPHKQNENDCVGIVDADWQINVRNEALKNLGSTAYAKAVENEPIPAGDWKCNLFVAHKATDGGAPVPWINGNLTSYPPTANQWAGVELKHIPNWTLLNLTARPQPGFEVSHGDPAPRGIGHTGILDYDGCWISAGHANVNRKADLRDRSYQPARIRKFN